MNKEELELLKKVAKYLHDIGLGEIYGCLGRMKAIVHNQLLNDNPNCYSVDINGNREIPNLTDDQNCLLNELASHIDQMLKDNSFYIQLRDLIKEYEKHVK